MSCINNRLGILSTLMSMFFSLLACAESPHDIDKSANNSIWLHDNLVAWEAASYDSKKRSSEERAKRGCSEFCVNPIMLKRGETHVKGIRL